MASLVLTTVGGALGGAFGGPLGMALGQAGGAFAGNLLAGGGGTNRSPRVTVGPRLTALNGISSTEGAPIPRAYGRARIGGQMIWATRFLEHVNYAYEPATGGKGGSTVQQPAQFEITYSYTANFAIGLCEGPIAFVRRIWADGQELDLATITFRVYTGTEDQEPDPLIAAVEAAGTVPAYRGLAYVVFEGLPIGPYGNRIPQLTFEIVRPVDGIGKMIRAVNIIPGATEFGYQPDLHISVPGPGTTVADNRNQYFATTDWVGSLDALQALCPNLENVALVVVWFGDDLRAGHCTIAPRVDNAFKTLAFPLVPPWITDWSVAGITRPSAQLVSFVDGAAAYGGTPSDASVSAAIANLRARGLSVVLYPFVMMDIPTTNALPDPWTGGASQPAFPWRGRITCDPAPGVAGSVDGTATAATQMSAFFTGYRAFILHYAALAHDAGGVDAFLIGSELVSLTRVRSASGVYPAVDALKTLATDVKAIVGAGTKLSYAADWTEYGAHVLGGGAEVRFPLDALWASTAVDFVGIDVYWPLSDWRDGDHLDRQIADTIYDLTYLSQRITSGEAYDWYYADDAARAAQTRLPITDGSYGKPWVFRQKDIAGWWSNAHVERVDGVETTATAWSPGAKQIWFTEAGCPAVDRGPNAPNVFPDPKSSEGGLPPFSRGVRDDLIQTRFIEAVLGHYDPAQPGFGAPNNPIGPHGLRMVDPSRIFLWAWDARPFPAFPALLSLWADAADWRTGHWLNGRLEGLPLDRLLAELAGDVDLPDSARVRPDVEGFIDGYVLDRPMSMRSAIEPLASLFCFDPVISSGRVRFASRARRSVATLTDDDLVPAKDGTLLHLTRGQESELPHEIAVSFGDSADDYTSASVLSRRIEGWAARSAQAESAVLANRGVAQRAADILLDDLWVARETASFDIDPGLLALEPGDIVTLDHAGTTRLLRIDSIGDGASRSIAARAIDPDIYDRATAEAQPPSKRPPPVYGPPFVVILDLAVARNDPVSLQYVAVTADPWPGPMSVFRQTGSAAGSGASVDYVTTLARRATIGVTLDVLPAGPSSRIDRGSSIRVKLHAGALASVSDLDMFGGANTFAIGSVESGWEIVSAANAELVDTATYRLSHLLRGQGGEDALAARTLAAGATVVLLDRAVMPLASGPSLLGASVTWLVGPAKRAIGDISYISVASTVTGKALMPYAPAQATATRTEDGIVIAWRRRGRIDSDAWEPVDIPLGEAAERYRVTITKHDGSARVLDVAATNVLYAAAEITADFPSAPATLAVSIVQISATVGVGFPLAVALPVG